MKKKMTITLSILLAFVMLSGCTPSNADNPISVGTPGMTEQGVTLLENMSMASDLSDISDVIEQLHRSSDTGGGWFNRIFGMETVVTEEAATDDAAPMEPEAPTAAPEPTPTSPEGENKDFSDTNVQVEGVMEADIVKTNGEYIYALAYNRLMIFKADGENTETISDTKLFDDEQKYDFYPSEMFLYGDKLAIINSGWGFYDQDENYAEDMTMVDIYDVSDPKNPDLLSSSGQSGYYNTSRMIGDNLYLITNYYIYDFDAGMPESYMPKLIMDEDYAMVDPIDVCIMPYPSTTHTVISNIDGQSGDQLGTLSLLGNAGEIYMSGDNLYLANTNYIYDESEPRQEGVYEVIDYKNGEQTELVRITLGDKPEIAATGTVPGGLLNQFSMDEYGGYFRVVTTDNSYSYTSYNDKEHDFQNTKFHGEWRTNGLYVLDLDLNIVGSVDKLAEDERVYSVRFDGDVGYFVTFRETDPLFTVDLTDPTNPVVQSELKIPGFSTYMQVYGEGRLFGIGMDADEETGATNGLKLSMFDTSDPFDVTEMHKEITDEYGSEALYNHKAILIAPSKDLIGFASWDSYFIYGYSDEDGFYLRSEISLNEMEEYYSYNMRGMYIGEDIYLIGENILLVLSLDTMDVVATLEF